MGTREKERLKNTGSSVPRSYNLGEWFIADQSHKKHLFLNKGRSHKIRSAYAYNYRTFQRGVHGTWVEELTE
jgi:hypothetical protein